MRSCMRFVYRTCCSSGERMRMYVFMRGVCLCVHIVVFMLWILAVGSTQFVHVLRNACVRECVHTARTFFSSSERAHMYVFMHGFCLRVYVGFFMRFGCWLHTVCVCVAHCMRACALRPTPDRHCYCCFSFVVCHTCVQTYGTTALLCSVCACACVCMCTMGDIGILDISDCGIFDGFIRELATAHQQLIKARRTVLRCGMKTRAEGWKPCWIDGRHV